MKVNVSYLVEFNNWFDVPKELEFFLLKMKRTGLMMNGISQKMVSFHKF